MRSCIRRLFFYSVLALFAAVILSALPEAASARSPNAGKLTIFGETVTADPGEDPHLKADPQSDPGPRELEMSTVSMTDEEYGTISGGRRGTGMTRGAGQTRVKTKLLITLQILFGHLLR